MKSDEIGQNRTKFERNWTKFERNWIKLNEIKRNWTTLGGIECGYHGQSIVPTINGDGEVERRDNTDHPQRIPHLQKGMVRSLRRDHFTFKHSRKTNGVVANVHVLLHFANALRQYLPYIHTISICK